MHFVVKRMSKKVLSVVLALMVLLSAVSVAFSALAGAADPADSSFYVTSAKPAIPMAEGSSISLDNIKVEFAADEFVAGTDITWINENEELVYNSLENSLTANAEGTFKIEAKKSETESKEIYVLVTAGELNKISIFDYTFTEADKGSSPDADSYYTFGGENKDLFTFYAKGGNMIWAQPVNTGEKFTAGLRCDNKSGWIVLNPTTEAGKLVSAFGDYTIEYNAVTHFNWRNDSKEFDLVGRYQMAGEAPNPANDTYLGYRARWSSTVAGGVYYNDSGAKQHSGNSSAIPDYNGARMMNTDFRLKLSGNDLVFSAKPEDAAVYSLLYTMSEDASAPEAAKTTAGQTGTVAWYTHTSNRPTMHYLRVFVEFTADELSKLEAPIRYYYVTAGKPAIPLNPESVIGLDTVKVEFAAGEYVAGTDLTWESLNDELVYDAENNSIVASAEGTFKLKAKKSDTEVKEIYVFVAKGDLSKIQIFNYDFTEADKGSADADSYYTFGGENKDLFTFYAKGGNMIWATPVNTGEKFTAGLRCDNKSGWIVLNPNAEEVELITEFADYTIEYNAVTHFNWRDGNKEFDLVGRYQMAGEAPDPANDTYLGYRARWSSTVAGGVYYNDSGAKQHSGNSSAIPDYNGSRMMNTDFRLKLSGDDLVFSAKPEDAVAYTELYVMSEDPEAPAAAKATAGQKGTVAWYTHTNNRPTMHYLRVFVEFSADELSRLVPPVTYFVVSEGRPAIPVKVNGTVALDKVKVEFSDGTTLKGNQITWVNENDELVYNDADNTLTATAEGTFKITAKKSDTVSREIYVFAKKGSINEIDIFNYTFSADDAGTAAAGEYYTYGGANKDLFTFYRAGGTMSWLKPDGGHDKALNGLTSTGSGYIALNTNADEAKIVADFADYTIEYSAATHYNWRDANKSFPMMGRYQMAGDAPNTANDTYLGYYGTWSATVPGSMAYNDSGAKTHVGNSIAVPDYVGSRMITVDFRLKLSGDDLVFSAKPNDVAAYSVLYTMSEDATAPEAAKATAGQKGTIVWYNWSDARPRMTHLRLFLEFTDAELDALRFGEIQDLDYNVLYLNTGDVFDLSSVNFIYEEEYYNGAELVFDEAPEGLTVSDGSITATTKGEYTLVGTYGEAPAEGEEDTRIQITIAIAVTDEGEIFASDNYQFKQNNGLIESYTRADDTKPFSQKLFIPDEVDGFNIYEIGAISLDNANTAYITEVEIEKYIEVIRASAFSGAVNLKKVIIPNTITTIGAGAFAGDVALEDVVLPGSVSNIERNAFKDATNLVVTIYNPDAVIGDGAFSAGATIKGLADSTAQAYATANGLTFVALDGDDKAAAEASCAEYEALVAARLDPTNIATQENGKVEFTIGYTNHYNVYNEWKVLGFKLIDRSCGAIKIPAWATVYDDKFDTEMTVNMWLQNGAMELQNDARAIYHVEFEEGMRTIGFWNFRGWTWLQSVKLPESLELIAQQCFKGCTSLKSITIPDSVYVIGLDAFRDCTNLEEINISENSNLMQLGGNGTADKTQNVFMNTQLKKLVLPVTFDELNKSFTRSVLSLDEIYIYNKDLVWDDSNSELKSSSWFSDGMKIYGYKGSTAEKIVEEDKSYKDNADPALAALYRGYEFIELEDEFYATHEGVADTTGKGIVSYVNYKSTTKDEVTTYELIIPSYYAYSGFVGVGGKVTLPGTAIYNGQEVKVTALRGMNIQGEPVKGIDRIINLEIGEGIQVIEESALEGTVYMKSVKFPSTLTTIGDKAFNKSGITGKIEIPASVTSIGQGAFRNTKLTEVTILNNDINIVKGAFDTTITIYGYTGSNAEDYAKDNKLKFVALDPPKDPEPSTPGTGNTTPGTGNTTPGTGNTTPGTGNTTPGTGNTTPGTGNTTPGTGNTTPGTGNTTPGTGNNTVNVVTDSGITVGMVVAISLGLLAILIAAVVVVIIIAKKRR